MSEFFKRLFSNYYSEEIKQLKKEQEIIKKDLQRLKFENKIFKAQQCLIEKITQGEKSVRKTRCQKVLQGKKCNKSIHTGKFCLKHKTKN